MTLAKIVATMGSCGVLTIEELQEKAHITLLFSATIRESAVHEVILLERESASVF